MGDYEDFLRNRGLPTWDKDSPQALAARQRLRSDQFDVSEFVRTATPEDAANTLLCLINQASYLLHRQLDRLEQDFLKNGGFTERLYAVRSQVRKEQSDKSGQSDRSGPLDKHPACPCCGKPMCQRTARRGPHAGQKFWGCSAYPECNGTRAIG